jgi:hypothetical protein
MKKVYPMLLAVTCLCCFKSNAQLSKFHGGAEVQGIFNNADTAEQMPFWMRANQFGSVPLPGNSGSLIATLNKGFDTNTKKFDWGLGFQARVNAGSDAEFILIESYFKIRYGVIELKAGRSKETTGLGSDPLLSSGSFSESGNSLPIPEINIGIRDYSNIFGGKLIALKGSLAHGWMGELPVQYNWNPPNTYPHPEKATTYLHQASLYVRLGKPEWKVKFYGGGNHQVMWGSEKEVFGPDWTLSPAKSFLYAATLHSFGNNSVLNSKVGNHVGSIDFGMEYNFPSLTLFIYRQNIYDADALLHFANGFDGLNGISLENKKTSDKLQLRKIVFEVLSTTNQNGDMEPKYLGSGDENYYNHPEYAQGWSYKGVGIGTPFISPKYTVRSGFPSSAGEYFINNRVLAFHTAMNSTLGPWTGLVKLSYSINHGTWATSPIGKRGMYHRDAPSPFVFPEANQFSGFIEVGRKLKKNMHVGIVGAVDAGDLFYNSAGIILKLSKSF